jgi:hypothetical protein
MIQQYRGDGTTTKQMQAAPQKAVFIWPNHWTDYPQKLARKLGREDLVIVGPNWLTDQRWAGRDLPGIVVDHATVLERPAWDELQRALTRVRPHADEAKHG